MQLSVKFFFFISFCILSFHTIFAGEEIKINPPKDQQPIFRARAQVRYACKEFKTVLERIFAKDEMVMFAKKERIGGSEDIKAESVREAYLAKGAMIFYSIDRIFLSPAIERLLLKSVIDQHEYKKGVVTIPVWGPFIFEYIKERLSMQEKI